MAEEEEAGMEEPDGAGEGRSRKRKGQEKRRARVEEPGGAGAERSMMREKEGGQVRTLSG